LRRPRFFGDLAPLPLTELCPPSMLESRVIEILEKAIVLYLALVEWATTLLGFFGV
jgi:hypothetical protein